MMANYVTYEILDALAVRYIPEGKHRYLHVNSREVWIDVMVRLIEKGFIKSKVSILAKCAKNWEFMLTTKLSILN